MEQPLRVFSMYFALKFSTFTFYTATTIFTEKVVSILFWKISESGFKTNENWRSSLNMRMVIIHMTSAITHAVHTGQNVSLESYQVKDLQCCTHKCGTDHLFNIQLTESCTSVSIISQVDDADWYISAFKSDCAVCIGKSILLAWPYLPLCTLTTYQIKQSADVCSANKHVSR